MYDFRRRHTMLNAMDKSQMPWYGKNLIFHARIKIAFLVDISFPPGPPLSTLPIGNKERNCNGDIQINGY